MDLERARKDLHILEVDLAYTQYYPYLEKYVSLYPNHETPSDTVSQDEKNRAILDKPRPDMWKLIESTMKRGETELVRLRERKDALYKGRQPGPKASGEGNQERAGRNVKHSEDVDVGDGEDGEGGGFFEEAV